MHMLKRAFTPEPHRDDMPSWQDVYEMVAVRAGDALRTAGIVIVIVAVLWGIGAIIAIAVAIAFGRTYLRHHRIAGTIARYQASGDWAIVEFEDGTEVAARCPIANLPVGTDVLVAVRRDGAYVISPPVWEGVPIEETLIEVASE